MRPKLTDRTHIVTKEIHFDWYTTTKYERSTTKNSEAFRYYDKKCSIAKLSETVDLYFNSKKLEIRVWVHSFSCLLLAGKRKIKIADHKIWMSVVSVIETSAPKRYFALKLLFTELTARSSEGLSEAGAAKSSHRKSKINLLLVMSDTIWMETVDRIQYINGLGIWWRAKLRKMETTCSNF